MAILRRVRPGEPLKIPASVYNQFLDLIEASRAGGTAGGSRGAAACVGVIYVRNDSETDVDRFGVLGIDAPVFDPAESESGFTDSGVLSGSVPAAEHQGRFVVVQEPILAGQVGRAVAAGLTVAQVLMRDDGERYADIYPGQTFLGSNGTGGAEILCHEPAGGECPTLKWCVVRLGIANGFQLARVDSLAIGEGPTWGPHHWYRLFSCDVNGTMLFDGGPGYFFALSAREVWSYLQTSVVPPAMLTAGLPMVLTFRGNYLGGTNPLGEPTTFFIDLPERLAEFQDGTNVDRVPARIDRPAAAGGSACHYVQRYTENFSRGVLPTPPSTFKFLVWNQTLAWEDHPFHGAEVGRQTVITWVNFGNQTVSTKDIVWDAQGHMWTEATP